MNIFRLWGWIGAFSLIFSFPLPASAATQNQMTVAHLGVHGPNAYMGFTTALTETCNFNYLYLDMTTDGGKAAYALLLTTHAAGRPLSRVDYHVDASGMCWIEIVEF